MKLLSSLMKNRAVVGLFAVMAVSVAVASPVLATDATTNGTDNFGLDTFGSTTSLGHNQNLPQIIAQIINYALGFLGIIAVIIVLYGGFKWMTAAGNEDKVGEAKKLFGAGIIGLIIIMLAYAISAYVFTQLAAATGTGQPAAAVDNGG